MTSGQHIPVYFLSNTESLSIVKNYEPPQYPDHPKEIKGATGGFLNNYFITCGGNDSVVGFSEYCHKLGVSPGYFAIMTTERFLAASVVLESEKLWILGGKNKENYLLSSTEYIFIDGRTEYGPYMPTELYGHAMAKINETAFILAGGYGYDGYSKGTWYYNGDWIDGPDLQKGRRGHSVGIVRDPFTTYVVVAGGYDGTYLNDVEILDVKQNKWWETGKLL